MKKSIYSFIGILFLTILLFLQFGTVVFADEKLETVKVEVNKAKVAPGEQVTLTTDFGQTMGAYTINVEYDPKAFSYVKSEGGAENDENGKVILTYHYVQQGSEQPRTNATITFKANDNIVADTPTDFSVTINGMSNPDNSKEYDDITVPFKKDVLIQPNYVDYSLALQYSGVILPNVAKDMKLVTSSTMGKNYDHVRLIATLTKTPSKEATAKLLATNSEKTEIDLLHSGWGEAEGYAIGGKNVKQELALKGEFSEIGNYTINVKLIDRDDEDKVIAQKDFNIAVGEQKKEEDEKLPATLPKTGGMQYVYIILAVSVLTIAYLYITKKNRK